MSTIRPLSTNVYESPEDDHLPVSVKTSRNQGKQINEQEQQKISEMYPDTSGLA